MLRKSLLAGLVYFALVFVAGFALGVLRVLVLVPRLGAGTSELIELPFVVLISYLAARFIVRWFSVVSFANGFVVGIVSLGLLIAIELTFVLGMQGLTLVQYVESREPLAFGAYLVSLLVFGMMPSILVGVKGKHDN